MYPPIVPLLPPLLLARLPSVVIPWLVLEALFVRRAVAAYHSRAVRASPRRPLGIKGKECAALRSPFRPAAVAPLLLVTRKRWLTRRRLVLVVAPVAKVV